MSALKNPTAERHFWDCQSGYIAADTWNLWTAQKMAATIHNIELELRECGVSEDAIALTLDALDDNLSDDFVWQTEDPSFDNVKRWKDDRLSQLRASVVVSGAQQEAA